MSTLNDQTFVPVELALELGYEVCRQCDQLYDPDTTPVPALCCRCWLAEGGDER